jgi:hypothetical protein
MFRIGPQDLLHLKFRLSPARCGLSQKKTTAVLIVHVEAILF